MSTSPYYHPILPLLCDSDAHREAHPGAYVPRRFHHPEDAADQIQRAIRRHEQVFGRPPLGMWPSEGSVSDAAVREIAKAGLTWAASDEGVLQRSLGRALHRDTHGTTRPAGLLYRPWVRATAAGPITLLFRDRALSDLIGFSYSGLDPEHAASDLLGRLRRVGQQWREEGLGGEPVVPIILDGENAWEHFKEGGRKFLRHLYAGLQDDPALSTVTMSEAAGAPGAGELPRVFAGSWIHADFSVWIGHADDRRAWDRLGEARDALAAAEASGTVPPARLERAWEILRAACGSDWCWWYGDDHSSENDLDFDRLFRRHLRAIYDSIGRPAPAALDRTLITTRHFTERLSQPAGEIAPVIDGQMTTAEEWAGAGLHRVPLTGAMHRASQGVRAIRFGRAGDTLCVFVESGTGTMAELLGQAEVELSFLGTPPVRFRVGRGGVPATLAAWDGRAWAVRATAGVAAAGPALEVAIPLSELPVTEGRLEFRVLVFQGDVEVERHPESGPIEVRIEEGGLEAARP